MGPMQPAPTKEQLDQAMEHLGQCLNDFTMTLPPSARGPIVQVTQGAMQMIRVQLAAGQTCIEREADAGKTKKEAEPKEK